MTKWLEEISWREVQDVVAETKTVLIPTGSVEVEGPHLPLGVDSIVSRYVAEKVSEHTNTVIAPLITLTYSGWHKMFPGTLSIKSETLTDILRQLCYSLSDLGFKRIVFINSHLGNDLPILVVANEMRQLKNVLVANVNLWNLATQIGQKKSGQLGLKENKFQHAGEIMTSVMLAIRPDLVKMDKAVCEYTKPVNKAFAQKGSFVVTHEGYDFNVYYSSGEVTKSGVMGDPTSASAEKGRGIIDEWVKAVSSFIAALAN